MKLLYLILLLVSGSLMAGEVKFQGLLEVKSHSQKAAFNLKKNENDEYRLIIRPVSATNDCEFSVQKMGAPQQVRGYRGYVFSNRDSSCLYKSKNEIVTQFWNKIELIDIFFIVKGKKLEGTATLKNINDSYSANLYFDN